MIAFGTQKWAPGTFTKPLTPDFPSDGPRLIELVEKVWKTPDGKPLVLEQWQKALLIHLLERYPADHPVEALRGRLRYRQVCVSVARQNGKSVLAAVLSLYGLLQQTAGPSVIGVASNREQAAIIYNRTFYVIKNTPQLNRRIKPTSTRGLMFRDGSGAYEVRASKGAALQGIPVTLALCDELHILDSEIWDALVNGTRAQADGMVLGISTAGDDTSLLLKRLYKQGAAAVSGENERFGFFLWEAPEGSTIDTPGAIEAANPSVAEGRIPIATVLTDVRPLPVVDQERYTLNRFVASINSWIPMASWWKCEGSGIPDGATDLVVAIDRTASWEFASVTATAKVDGKLYTQLIASIEKPNLESLIRVCEYLGATHNPTFAVDASSLSALGNALKDRGFNVWKLTSNEMAQAASMAYANIVASKVSFPKGSTILNMQMPRAKRKNVGEGWRITKAGSTEIDALMSTVVGMFVAETKPEKTMQLF